MAPSGAAGATAGPAAPSADAKTKGQALLAKAVEGIGGAAALDGLTSYVAAGEVSVKTPGGDMTLQTNETLAPPDRFRQDMTVPGMGNMAIVIAGADGIHGVAAGRAADAGVDAAADRGSARARAAAAPAAAHPARVRGGRCR